VVKNRQQNVAAATTAGQRYCGGRRLANVQRPTHTRRRGGLTARSLVVLPRISRTCSAVRDNHNLESSANTCA